MPPQGVVSIMRDVVVAHGSSVVIVVKLVGTVSGGGDAVVGACVVEVVDAGALVEVVGGFAAWAVAWPRLRRRYPAATAITAAAAAATRRRAAAAAMNAFLREPAWGFSTAICRGI
jgi:hypothetical protein